MIVERSDWRRRGILHSYSGETFRPQPMRISFANQTEAGRRGVLEHFYENATQAFDYTPPGDAGPMKVTYTRPPTFVRQRGRWLITIELERDHQ